MQQGEGTPEGRRHPSPAMVLAVSALIAALGGTAVAVQKIGSNDIAKNAVRSKHIKGGQVKSADTDVVKHARVTAELEHNGANPVPLGPKVSVRAKRGDLLTINARVTIRRIASTAPCYVNMGFDGPGSVGDDARVLTRDGAGPFVAYITFGSEAGTDRPFEAQPWEVPIVEAGRYVVTLAAQTGTGLTYCSYTDRNLWVEVSR